MLGVETHGDRSFRRGFLPSHKFLLHLQQPLMCLLHQRVEAVLDLLPGRQVQLMQASGVAFLRLNLRVPGQTLNAPSHCGTAELFPAPGDKHRAGAKPAAPYVPDQLLPQAGRNRSKKATIYQSIISIAG